MSKSNQPNNDLSALIVPHFTKELKYEIQTILERSVDSIADLVNNMEDIKQKVKIIHKKAELFLKPSPIAYAHRQKEDEPKPTSQKKEKILDAGNILKIMVEIFEAEKKKVMKSKDLVTLLTSKGYTFKDFPINTRTLSQNLRPYDIQTSNFTAAPGKLVWGYAKRQFEQALREF